MSSWDNPANFLNKSKLKLDFGAPKRTKARTGRSCFFVLMRIVLRCRQNPSSFSRLRAVPGYAADAQSHTVPTLEQAFAQIVCRCGLAYWSKGSTQTAVTLYSGDCTRLSRNGPVILFRFTRAS